MLHADVKYHVNFPDIMREPIVRTATSYVVVYETYKSFYCSFRKKK